MGGLGNQNSLLPSVELDYAFLSQEAKTGAWVQPGILHEVLLTQLVKNPPAMQETLVRFLGQEDLLEKGSATHSSILALLLWLSW